MFYSEGDEDSWSEITVKEYNVNFKAHYALLQGLNDDDFSKIIIAHVHMIFSKFWLSHIKSLQVKKAKIDLLSSQYDSFHLFDDESIDDMFTHFTTNSNVLISLGSISTMIKIFENH